MDKEQFPRWARVEMGRRNPGYFFQRYFGYYATRPMADMHHRMLAISDDLCKGKRSRHAVEGARGHGKSVYLNMNTVIRSAALGFHKFIVLIGAPGGAEQHMANIVDELETNPLLKADFGEAIRPDIDNKGQVRKWADSHVILRNGCKISALTKGRSIRGLRHGQYRPSLILIDDAQKDEDVLTFERRTSDQDWLTQQVINAMPAGGEGCVGIVDTVKHDDCLVRWMGNNPQWNHASFPAEENGQSQWLDREALDTIRQEIGDVSYCKEYLLQPRDPSQQIFDWSKFRTFSPDDVVTGPDGATYIGGDKIQHIVISHDPIPLLEDSKDRRKVDIRRGDYASTVVAAMGTQLHKLGAADRPIKYILEDVTVREPLEWHLRKIATLAEKWNPKEVIIESNAFAAVAERDLRLLLRDRGIGCSVRGDVASTRKMSRIFSMDAAIERGEIRFSLALSPVFRSQWADLRRDESHQHDDAPDATEKAFRALAGRAKASGSGARFGPRRRQRTA